MRKTNFEGKNISKKWIILSIILILLIAMGILVNWVTFASSAISNQNPTKSILEINQSDIDGMKTQLANSTNQQDRTNLQRKINSAIFNATQLALDQTMVPTLISDKLTRIVQLTAETPQPPSGISITREPGLIQGDVSPMLAPNIDMTGSWLDRTESRYEIIYYAGAMKNTGQGAIAVFENKTYSVKEYVTVEVTGKLTISGKTGEVLVLDKEKGGTIFFNTKTLQFSTSILNGKLIPMATSMPTSIPMSRSTSVPSNPYP